MAVDSRRQVLPPGMDRAAITPPPSIPIPDSDDYGWSSWALEDLHNLGDPLLFDSSSLGLPGSGEDQQPPAPQGAPALDRTTVAAPLPSPQQLWSSSPPSPRRSPNNPADSTTSGLAIQPPADREPGNPVLPPLSMAQQSRKRFAAPQSSSASQSSSKRARTLNAEPGPTVAGGNETPEAVDLLAEEDVVISSMVQQQEEQKKDKEPTKLSQLQCVICLEPPTDLTATHCGHLFCHACLMAAIASSEPSRSKCPVCRRSVSRVKKNSKGEYADFQPLELKFTRRSAREKDAAKR